MPEQRTIGEILKSFGRVTEADVERALAHQEKHGGYFGESLLALGLVTPDELEYSLASQFDLPFVFPEADSIDPEAAALVSPEWALANLTLPIMETAEQVTVIVDSPIKTKAVEELQARTDKEIQLALASSSKIRELIREVYARAAAHEEGDRPSPVSLADFLALALDALSSRFGISSRGHRAWAWYEDEGRIRRRPLEGLWESDLEELLAPGPGEEVGDRLRAKWRGHVSRAGMSTPVEVRYLSDESGKEYLFVPFEERSALQERFSPPPAGILSEVRLLARSGTARFVVVTDPSELGHELLPHLPTLLLDPAWRSIYINDRAQRAADEAFSVELPEDDSGWVDEMEALRAFHFDVVTVDLRGNPEEWVGRALDIASVAFLLWDDDTERKAAHQAGVRWELQVERREGQRLEWTLEPLRA